MELWRNLVPLVPDTSYVFNPIGIRFYGVVIVLINVNEVDNDHPEKYNRKMMHIFS